MRILTNHLGYDAAAPKRAVLQSDHHDQVTHCDLVRVGDLGETLASESLHVLYRGPVQKWKNWHFWELDFSDERTPGRYCIEAGHKRRTTRSVPFMIGEHTLARGVLSDLLFYFKSQRITGDLDRWDRAASFVDGREGRVDTHGGWWDASGDSSRVLSHLNSSIYMNPQQAPLAVWALQESERWISASALPGQAPLIRRLREETAHGADGLARMQDPEGFFYLACMTKDQGRVIASFDYNTRLYGRDYRCGWRSGGGMAVAALAAASRRGLQGELGPVEYLRLARRGYDHLLAHGLGYLHDQRENMLDDYCALMAATELHAAAPDAAVLAHARQRASQLLERLMKDSHGDGWWRADAEGKRPFYHASDAGLPAVALSRYLEVDESSPLREAVVDALIRSARHLLHITQEVTNPFQCARQLVSSPSRPGLRRSFFIPHDNESGYWWQGENARLASVACQCLVTAEAAGGENARLAKDLAIMAQAQVDWVLGLNPYDVCMLVGQGRNNPDFMDIHRNAPGGIANGITGGVGDDEHGIDFFPPEQSANLRMNWRWGEEWIPHAAWAFLAVARLESRYCPKPPAA